MAEYLAENSRLRQLSRRYAKAELAKEDYRIARREILDALESGKVEAFIAAEPVVPSVKTETAAMESTAVYYKTMPPSGVSASLDEEENGESLRFLLPMSTRKYWPLC